RVRAAGCVAGVISNSNGSVRSVLEATGLARDLAFVIDSAVVGVEKPDPRIFRLGLAEAGVTAGEAVYIGDLYSVDVLGAYGAGLGAVLLDPRGFWGPRDCPRARDLDEAVSLTLDGFSGG
ncbi:MAG TPA: HAD family hydrolase, partial [Methylomirabilota bacterium]|nr:HAD family hydrolase [Methylomirabilota bacterium]